MADPVKTYVATILEVKRIAQLSRQGSSSDEAGGNGSGASGGDTDWVVLDDALTAAPMASGCSVWPPQQWQIAYEILFCQCPPSISRLRPHQADDMLFFVYSDEAVAAAKTRLFVRRRNSKQQALPADLQWAGEGGYGSTGSSSSSAGAGAGSSKGVQVDWHASVLLMVVLQTAYRLSVVTAGDAQLLNAFVEGDGDSGSSGGGGADGGTSSSVLQVTKVVHASPSRVPVNMDNSRSEAGRPQVSYPDISFAVDDCDDAFQSQVLRQPADCYCVLLHADVASSWRLPAAQAAGSSEAAAVAEAGLAAMSLSEQQPAPRVGQPGSSIGSGGSSSAGGQAAAQTDAEASQPAAAVAFSGFVSHQQLSAALGSQLAGDPLRKVLRAAAAAARGERPGQRGGGEGQPLATCRVSMRGPGGKGAADVAVSSYPPAGDGGHLGGATAGGAAAEGQGSPASSGSGGGGGRPKLLQRAQLIAMGMAAAAKQAAAPKGRGGSGGGEGGPQQLLHLKCALMALQLPVESLADSILQAL